MCEDLSNHNNSKGDVDMPTAVNKIDIALAELLRKNKDKIKSITPSNPPISKDDEWRDEDEWDDLYKELQDK